MHENQLKILIGKHAVKSGIYDGGELHPVKVGLTVWRSKRTSPQRTIDIFPFLQNGHELLKIAATIRARVTPQVLHNAAGYFQHALDRDFSAIKASWMSDQLVEGNLCGKT